MVRLCALAMAAVSLLSAAGAVAQARQAEIVQPEEWLGPENYPVDAIRKREQGRVVVVVSIDAAGKATGCRTDISIGAPTLEKATCDLILAKGRFSPARSASGQTVASNMTVPVRWVLPKVPDGEPSGPLDFALVGHVGADDRMLSCEMLVGGKLQTQPGSICPEPQVDLAELRKLTGEQGPLRIRVEVAIQHGDEPPLVPPSDVNGRLLVISVARHAIDAEGVPSACSVTITGEMAAQARANDAPNACDRKARFQPVIGPDGKTRRQQVMTVTRVILSPAN